LKRLPATWVADAGYGNEENYVFLEKEEVEAYLKYPGFDREKQKRAKLSEKEKHQSRHFKLQPDQDIYLCPQGKTLHFEKLAGISAPIPSIPEQQRILNNYHKLVERAETLEDEANAVEKGIQIYLDNMLADE